MSEQVLLAQDAALVPRPVLLPCCTKMKQASKLFHAFPHSVELAVLLEGGSRSQVLNTKLLIGTAAAFS